MISIKKGIQENILNFTRCLNHTIKINNHQCNINTVNTTLNDKLHLALERTPDKEFAVFPEQNIRKTFLEFYIDVLTFASGLNSLSLKHGDRIGIWSDNHYECLQGQYAAAYAGLIAVNIDSGFEKVNLEKALKEANVNALICSNSEPYFYQTLSELIPEMINLPKGISGLKSQKFHELKYVILFNSEQYEHGAFSLNDVSTMGTKTNQGNIFKIQGNMNFKDLATIQYTLSNDIPTIESSTHETMINKAIAANTKLQNLNEQTVTCIPGFLSPSLPLNAILNSSSIVIPSSHFEIDKTIECLLKEQCNYIVADESMLNKLCTDKALVKVKDFNLECAIITDQNVSNSLYNKLSQHFNVNTFITAHQLFELPNNQALVKSNESYKDALVAQSLFEDRKEGTTLFVDQTTSLLSKICMKKHNIKRL